MFYVLHHEGKLWLSDDESSWDAFCVAQCFFDKEVAIEIAKRESKKGEAHMVMELHH